MAPNKSRSVSRGRSSYRTPNSKRKRTRSNYRSNSANMLLDLVDSITPNPFMKTATNFARRLNRSSSSKRSSGASNIMSAGLGGKVKKINKKYSKKIKNKGKYTLYGLEMKGITLAYEKRAVLARPSTEAVAVGHTSLPAKVCLINMFRAMVKAIVLKTCTTISNYADSMTSAGFVVGDVIALSFYLTGDATTFTTVNYTVNSTSTFDDPAASYAADFDDNTGRSAMRWAFISFIPVSSSLKQACSINLTSMKIAVAGKSTLKIQNVTTETDANDEKDDVTNVPLHGKIYKCKGNNFVRKSNGKMLDGMFDSFNEEALYGTWGIQNSSAIGGTSVGFYSSAVNDTNVFLNPAEIPKPWEINNCKAYEKFSIAAGSIKTSVITYNFEMSLAHFTRMLLSGPVSLNTALVYEPKLGTTNVIYLDKVIGRTSTAVNQIRLWCELEFRQSMIIFGKENEYTNPIAFQANVTV